MRRNVRLALFLSVMLLTVSVFILPVAAEKEVASYNPLTGLALADPTSVAARPVAIMINNIKIATPQAGLSAADILYELEVEGSITRQMAVFSNVAAVPEIGSIRSLRHDFIELAGAFDAIVVHFGGSTVAYDTIKNLGTVQTQGLPIGEIQNGAKRAAMNTASKLTVLTWPKRSANLACEPPIITAIVPGFISSPAPPLSRLPEALL